jgi:hypothetical protein
MKKKWLIVSLLSMFLFALTSSAFAWSPNLNGKPDQFYPDGPKGYYIWHDEHGFHLWTTTRGEEHVFSGVIRTDGRFFHVRGHRLEAGDSLKVYSDVQDKFWFNFSEDNVENHFAFVGREVNMENDKIHFKFDTTGGSDGLNFRVKDASFIDFDLFIDGHPIPHRKIYIGDRGWHPDSHNFKVYE